MNPVPPSNKGKRVIKINAITQAHLIKLLLDGLYTCYELADLTGLHYITVLHYTRELHRAGAAYVFDYEQDSDGRDRERIYKIGVGKDKPRRKLTATERQRLYRARKAAKHNQKLLTFGVANELPAL